ncbi:YgiW/YdeI family stress tolerance OB fold protein [Biostraticola tofi]|uniref:Uncharacterized protein (TIGR00156 family) n=1 Tax=Biostraticola tofi TaxID=466109 RepID=A0A4R3Z5I4_9GAMM|nr:NirD/YgiW/YdeI family stress tolerance protein [Biostraticola tofi]TCW00493.1 uncharacterized protein (TIGR00156 family) [Biostraticola tofi]
MKRLIIAGFFTLASLPALAQPGGGFKADAVPPPPEKHDSGYRGTEDAKSTSIEDVKALRDGAWVTLEGHIIRKIDDRRYEFRDNTGSINIKVAGDTWNDQEVSPEDLIVISGKKHQSGNTFGVDVEYVLKQ